MSARFFNWQNGSTGLTYDTSVVRCGDSWIVTNTVSGRESGVHTNTIIIPDPYLVCNPEDFRMCINQI